MFIKNQDKLIFHGQIQTQINTNTHIDAHAHAHAHTDADADRAAHGRDRSSKLQLSVKHPMLAWFLCTQWSRFVPVFRICKISRCKSVGGGIQCPVVFKKKETWFLPPVDTQASANADATHTQINARRCNLENKCYDTDMMQTQTPKRIQAQTQIRVQFLLDVFEQYVYTDTYIHTQTCCNSFRSKALLWGPWHILGASSDEHKFTTAY